MISRHEIGSGAYGQVFSYPEDKKAMKLIPIKKEGLTNLQSFVREIDVLRHSNEYIVQYFKCAFRYGSIEIHMELMDCDILKYIRQKQLTDNEILVLTQDISHGLHFLHSHSITHRDIKPSNILLKRTDKGLRAKLCDFGLSRKFSNELHRGSDYMVTRWYRAPEIINTKESYGFAIDMWAFGCIVYEMYTRRPLFAIEDQKHLTDELVRLPSKLDRISNKQLKHIVTNLVIENPKHRWTAKKCVAEIALVPSPVYSKAYYVGSTITNLNAKDWFDTILEEFPDHERSIMHGLMLFNGSGMDHFDFQCSIFVGYLLYESYWDDEEFVDYLWSGEKINCKDVAAWICNHTNGPHMLSQYEYTKNA